MDTPLAAHGGRDHAEPDRTQARENGVPHIHQSLAHTFAVWTGYRTRDQRSDLASRHGQRAVPEAGAHDRGFLDLDGKDATMLYGIGKYGSDSYEIFFKQNYSVKPTDKELVRYLREEIFATA